MTSCIGGKWVFITVCAGGICRNPLTASLDVVCLIYAADIDEVGLRELAALVLSPNLDTAILDVSR